MDRGEDEDVARVRRLSHRVGLRVTGLSLLVVAFIIVTWGAVLPAGPGLEEATAPAIPALVLTFVVAGSLSYLAIINRLRRVLVWQVENRRPRRAERELLATFPGWVSGVVGLAWLFGTLVTAAVDLHYLGINRTAVLGAIGAVLGAANAIALTYVVVENTLIEVTTDAMRDEEPSDQDRRSLLFRLVSIWTFASGAAFLATLLAPFAVPESDGYQELRRVTFASSVFGFSIGLAAMVVSGRRLNRQVQQLRVALGEVQRGDLSARVVVDDAGAIGSLQAGFNQMTVALGERHRLERVLGRQVGEVAMGPLLEIEATRSGRGERREVSVLFLDLVSSTTVAETLPAEEVVSLINLVFEDVVDVVEGEDGWVNRFLGDAALCVFGGPVPVDDHAERAVRAAVELKSRLLALTAANPMIDAGIGLASGEVVLGNIGTASREEYTVIGDAVNVAARLTDLAKSRPGRLLAVEQTVRSAGVLGRGWRWAESLTLRGRSTPSEIWEHVAGPG